jgi:phosphatidylethanolamine N-methyltransferase
MVLPDITLEEFVSGTVLTGPVLAAMGAIVLHVAHYNLSARLEFNTRLYTRLFGKHAIYFYAALLVICALARDHFIERAIDRDPTKALWPWFHRPTTNLLGNALLGFGILLNLWTLQALGIKGMYNGDRSGLSPPPRSSPAHTLTNPTLLPFTTYPSQNPRSPHAHSFGWVMDAPVTGGPYRWFSDPQYFGTTAASLGFAIYKRSLVGLFLTLFLGLFFWFSVAFLEV